MASADPSRDDSGPSAFQLSQEVKVPKHLGMRFPELKSLASLIECPVCYRLLREPLSTPCGHTFCSLCVREYLTFKQQCPLCLMELHESKLFNNKALKSVADNLLKLIPKLEKNSGQEKPSFFLAASPTISPKPSSSVSKAPLTPASKSSAFRSPEISFSTPKRSFLSQISSSPKPSTSKCEVLSEAVEESCVCCPVCGVSIPEKNINRHLDSCLVKKDQHPVSEAKAQPKFKMMNKVVYHLLKDGQLKKLLKDVGLSIKGDRKSLEWRHKRFIVLWNSQSDSEKPLSKMEVRMEVEREERGLNKERTFQPKTLEYDRNTDPTIIAKKQKEYVNENNNHFAELIDQIKNRRKKELKPPTSPQLSRAGSLSEHHDMSPELQKFVPETAIVEDSDSSFHIEDPNINSSAGSTEKHQQPICNSENMDFGETEDLFSYLEPPISSNNQIDKYVPSDTPSESQVSDQVSQLDMKSNDIESKVKVSETKSNSGKGTRFKGECPICHQRILLSKMENHVDICISSKEEKPKRSRRKPSVKTDDDFVQPCGKRKCTRTSRQEQKGEIENRPVNGHSINH